MPGMEGIVNERAPAYTKTFYTRKYILTGSRNISHWEPEEPLFIKAINAVFC